MKKEYYWDNFANTLVEEKDSFAAPERYIRLYSHDLDFFIEHWHVGNNKALEFCWDEKDRKIVNEIRELHFKDNGIEDMSKCRLFGLGYPKKVFDAMLASYKKEN